MCVSSAHGFLKYPVQKEKKNNKGRKNRSQQIYSVKVSHVREMINNRTKRPASNENENPGARKDSSRADCKRGVHQIRECISVRIFIPAEGCVHMITERFSFRYEYIPVPCNRLLFVFVMLVQNLIPI